MTSDLPKLRKASPPDPNCSICGGKGRRWSKKFLRLVNCICRRDDELPPAAGIIDPAQIAPMKPTVEQIRADQQRRGRKVRIL